MSKLDLTEILKDAPCGLELYSPVFGYGRFGGVVDVVHTKIIKIATKYDEYMFTMEGKLAKNKIGDNDNGECLLFPSESHRSWNNWQEVLFEEGDVISYSLPDKTVTITYSEDLKCSQTFKINDCRYATKEEKEETDRIRWNVNHTDEIADKTENQDNELHPFCKVIVRNTFDRWKCDFFSHYNATSGLYFCVGGSYIECLPYNEKTQKLLGTKI